MEVSIKSIDSLGRIVIPSNVRKNLNIYDDTLLGIDVIDDKIVLSKIDLVEKKNNELLIRILKELLNTDVIVTNMNKILASTKKELLNEDLSKEFVLTLQNRKKTLANGLQIALKKDFKENYLIYPILKNSVLYGSIVMFLKDNNFFSKNEVVLDLIVKLYLENYS